MNRKCRRVPSYRLHKPSGQARVIIDQRHVYLGRYGTPVSWEKYNRLIAEHLNGGDTGGASWPSASGSYSVLSVNEVVLSYWQFAQGYYVKGGEVTGEVDNIRAALRPLKQLYGSTEARVFGPDALETVRTAMIESGLSRKVINARISRIKRMFRWACKKRMIPPVVYSGLRAVEGLQRGRSQARETEPVKPVVEEHVRAVLPHVTPQIRAMIQVQELAGMRPQEVRNMRTCDIDVTQDVWIYEPFTHKNEHHGHERRVAIGPRAQELLRPFLKPDDSAAYIFSPKEAVAALRDEGRRRRKSPLTPSERRRKPKSKPRRVPGNQYTKSSYETAIARTCKKAGVPHWAPNQLRHNCGTKVRRRYGIEGAAAVLGHSLGMVAEVYSEANFQKAIDIMREVG